MKKCFLFVLSVALAFVFTAATAWSAESSTDEFMLQEITVTAEKRATNLQKLPSSVAALSGSDLATQSRITTEQILQNVPNITFRDGGGQNPDGNIAIRGIQRTQTSGGVDDVLPSTTAVYVDDIYEGIGGHYDVNRVEVLRGPQGTLYGRSATGGVIAFHTNDPNLGEFSGDISAEYGNHSLVNVEGALNVPVGDKVAIRAAAHYYSRDGYFDAQGGKTTTYEGRIKALFQPTDPLKIVLQAAIQQTQDWGGGYTMTLIGPDTIDYHYAHSTPSKYPLKKYDQLGLNANYDFGNSTLTWIGGYHTYDSNGLGPEVVREGSGARATDSFPTDWFHSEEVRWASNTEGALSWLVGANYFKHVFVSHMGDYQTFAPGVPDDIGFMAPRYMQDTDGDFLNYGFFTEETYKLRDNFRITAGLRYDYTNYTLSQTFMENENHPPNGGWYTANPPIWSVGTLKDSEHTWDNITYKLRFEYDVTPDNMIYFTTATGFLPGYQAVNPVLDNGVVTSWIIKVLDEQKLTSYELGTKNQFLNDRLRVNGDVFYYDLAGYPEGYDVSLGGPHQITIISTPIEVIGAELQAEYLPTMNDRVTLTLGYQRPKITGWPDSITWIGGWGAGNVVTPGRDAAMLDIQPGHPQFEGTLAYEHNFSLSNGSSLVPRVELHYTSAYYLSEINYLQVDYGEKPYDHQDAVTLCNANVVWTSASQKYSVTGWVQNAFDKEYKTGVSMVAPGEDLSTVGVSVGDPRTFGVMVNAKF